MYVDPYSALAYYSLFFNRQSYVMDSLLEYDAERRCRSVVPLSSLRTRSQDTSHQSFAVSSATVKNAFTSYSSGNGLALAIADISGT